MELKLDDSLASVATTQRLNRTFYGIETLWEFGFTFPRRVLIVPFMELKQVYLDSVPTAQSVLIVPFMELKLW